MEADLDAELEALELELSITPCEDTHVRCLPSQRVSFQLPGALLSAMHSTRASLAAVHRSMQRSAGAVHGLGRGRRVRAKPQLHAVRLPRRVRALRRAACGHASAERCGLAKPW